MKYEPKDQLDSNYTKKMLPSEVLRVVLEGLNPMDTSFFNVPMLFNSGNLFVQNVYTTLISKGSLQGSQCKSSALLLLCINYGGKGIVGFSRRLVEIHQLWLKGLWKKSKVVFVPR